MSNSGLASIEKGKELDAPLEEPALPTATWKALAHSDSTASIDADERIVADRVDSVALAHMRLDRLHNANDSLAVTRKRLSDVSSSHGESSSGSTAAPGSPGSRGASRLGQDSEPSSPERGTPARKSPQGFATGLKKLSGVFKTGLHLGKDSPRTKSQNLSNASAGSDSSELPPMGTSDFKRRSSGGVRFSMDEPRVIEN